MRGLLGSFSCQVRFNTVATLNKTEHVFRARVRSNTVLIYITIRSERRFLNSKDCTVSALHVLPCFLCAVPYVKASDPIKYVLKREDQPDVPVRERRHLAEAWPSHGPGGGAAGPCTHHHNLPSSPPGPPFGSDPASCLSKISMQVSCPTKSALCKNMLSQSGETKYYERSFLRK